MSECEQAGKAASNQEHNQQQPQHKQHKPKLRGPPGQNSKLDRIYLKARDKSLDILQAAPIPAELKAPRIAQVVIGEAKICPHCYNYHCKDYSDLPGPFTSNPTSEQLKNPIFWRQYISCKACARRVLNHGLKTLKKDPESDIFLSALIKADRKVSKEEYNKCPQTKKIYEGLAEDQPISQTRLVQLVDEAFQSAVGSGSSTYEHSATLQWNTQIINHLTAALVSEVPPASFKFIVNSIIIQHSAYKAEPSGLSRGMHAASGAYWDDERDGSYSHTLVGGKERDWDCVVTVAWIALD